MVSPVFVAIEGIDACGKASQARRLAAALEARLFVFPNKNSSTGRLIYGHLSGEWGCGPGGTREAVHLPSAERTLPYLNGMVFQCIHFTNQLEMAPEIMATLKGGRPVVADRYLASAVAYGMAEGLSYDWLVAAQEFLPQPDLNILLDISVETSFDRRPERRDRYEADKPYLEEVAKSYQKLWADKGWLVVDGNGPESDVHDKIMAAVLSLGSVV